MGVLSWLVYGVLCILAEFISGKGYLIAIGLAFSYPAAAEYLGATLVQQWQIFAVGALLHSGILFMLRRGRKRVDGDAPRVNIGDRVEVIEWLDECSARVRYRGEEWQADKVIDRMPDAAHGTIQSVKGTRLVIATDVQVQSAVAMPD